MLKRLLPAVFVLISLFLLSACGSNSGGNPATALSTLTINPSDSTITDARAAQYTSTQFFTITVIDERSRPLSDVTLGISYIWAAPNAAGLVQLYDGNTQVDSPFEAQTDEYGQYHLRVDFQSGAGLEYSASIQVTSGVKFTSATFAVETGGS